MGCCCCCCWFWADPLAALWHLQLLSCPVLGAATSSSAVPDSVPTASLLFALLSCKVPARGPSSLSSSSRGLSPPGWLWRRSLCLPEWSPAPGDVPYPSFDFTAGHKRCHVSRCLALSMVTAGRRRAVAIAISGAVTGRWRLVASTLAPCQAFPEAAPKALHPESSSPLPLEGRTS